jgi:hypothetical protein
VTLDGLVARGIVPPERAGLLWIDAQGHEPAVLAGASSLIDAGVPMVVAVRQVKGDPETARPWVAPSGLRARVLASLRAGYTEAVELRKHSQLGRKVHPIDDLDVLVDSFRHCQDLCSSAAWRSRELVSAVVREVDAAGLATERTSRVARPASPPPGPSSARSGRARILDPFMRRGSTARSSAGAGDR